LDGNKAGGSATDMANFKSDQSFPLAQNPLPEPQPGGLNPLQTSSPADAGNSRPQTFDLDSRASSLGSESVDQKYNNVNNTSPLVIAEDSDLIDKEWVYKAKSIVEKTQNNPYTQSQELARLRTEYLQERYGKIMNSNEQNI